MRCPTYHLSKDVLLEIIWSLVRGKRRSFQQDSRRLARGITSMSILGEIPLLPPSKRGWLVLTNHYYRPGYHAWWSVIGVSAVFPGEIHWVIASTWTYPDRIRTSLLSPLLHWFFDRLAFIYNFTTMPPMPPRTEDLQQRSASVRRAANYVRTAPFPVVGLSPEGRDTGPQQIGEAPPGVGRWIQYLNQHGLALLPVGVYEDGPCLMIKVGSILTLDPGHPSSPADQDRLIAGQVMQAIGACLPSHFKYSASSYKPGVHLEGLPE